MLQTDERNTPAYKYYMQSMFKTYPVTAKLIYFLITEAQPDSYFKILYFQRFDVCFLYPLMAVRDGALFGRQIFSIAPEAQLPFDCHIIKLKLPSLQNSSTKSVHYHKFKTETFTGFHFKNQRDNNLAILTLPCTSKITIF